MNLNGVELTAELMEKLHNVESLEELKAVVKEAGIDIPAEKLAEYFDAEMKAFIMPEEDLKQVAGGYDWGEKKNKNKKKTNPLEP